MKFKSTIPSTLAALSLCVALAAQEQDLPKDPAKEESEAKASAENQELGKKLGDSVVTVQYRFKFDNGDDPVVLDTWGLGQQNQGGRVDGRKPLELPGYVLSNGEILTPDLLAPSRFVKSITVTRAGIVRKATISGENLEKGALFLKVDGPLNATPLQFATDKTLAPKKIASFWPEGETWRMNVQNFSASRPFLPELKNQTPELGPKRSLILAKDGTPLGFLMRENEMSGEWRGDPAAWAKDSQEKIEQLTQTAQTKVEKGLYLVKLYFKLPPPKPNNNPFDVQTRRQALPGSPDTTAEAFALGVPVDAHRLVALSNLSPEQLASLDSVKIAKADGSDEFAGVCVASLKDFKGLLIEPKDPAKAFETIPASPAALSDLKGKPLLFLNYEIYPDKLTGDAFIAPANSLEKGFRNILQLRSPASFGGSYDKTETVKLAADLEGRLAGVQLEGRRKPNFNAFEYMGGMNVSHAPLFAPRDLEGIASDPSLALAFTQPDKDNRRDPWLGAEVQKMTPALAKMNKASQATRNGRLGAIVSLVFDNSPAAKAGLQKGDILLRVFFDGDCAPVDIEITEPFANNFEFPWAQIENMPDSMIQRMPPPWGASANPMNKFFAQLGVGSKYSLEIFRDGKLQRVDGLTVEPGLEDFANASKVKIEKLGLTVKTLTYEARRYFKMSQDAPGVIISKVESGSKASIAGLKPYEVIVSVDGQPVGNVKEFKNLVEGKDEVRFLVNRLATERSVKIIKIAQENPNAESN